MDIFVASYARFSSQNQREASIEIQQEHINRFCKENRFTIIREYVDRGLSATTDNRPQFKKMMEDAATGLFKAVVIYNSSRFCRNIQDHLRYKSLLESYGVKILSVQEDFDQTTPEGGLMSHVMMSFNEYYSKDLSRKIYYGCLENAKKGLHVGGPAPFGYSITKEKRFEINESEAEIVRIIFNQVAEGKTYPEIAKYLNENGYRRRDGSLFTPYFFDLVSNRKYLGEYVWNRTKKKDAFGNRVSRLLKDEDEVVRIPNAIPQIIDEELFNKVQEIVASRKVVRQHNSKGKFLLSSLIVCGECGFKMSGDRNINGNGKGTYTRIVYKCDTHLKRNGGCHNKPINAIRLENYIINLVNAVLLNTSYAKNFSRLIKKMVGVEYEIISSKIEKTKIDIADLKVRIDNLVSALSNARSMAYQEILKSIEKNSSLKLKKEEQVQKLEEQLLVKPLIHEEIIFRRMVKYRKAISDNEKDSLKTLLKLLIKEIRINEDTVETVVRLNAYLTSALENEITITIVESRENIKDVEKQSNLALTWPMLNIKYL